MNVGRSGVVSAISMIEGHHRFLVRNTGDTNDAEIDKYVVNDQGVLANNRHFISHTRQEYQPNGDATTEGQSLQVLGYVHAYLATGDKRFLDEAIWYWEAYVNYFYAGQAIPESPQRWIANWLVNGKEPVLSNWPINPTAPTAGGYKGVPLVFTNGEAQIPHGSPFWGEYLDVASFAYRGHLGWNSMVASVRAIENEIDWQEAYDNYRVTTMPAEPYDPRAWIDWVAYLGAPYTPSWSGTNPPEYPVDWIIAWTGNKIDSNGDIIEEGFETTDVGKIKLKNTSINGVYLFNYAVRLPVEHGGYMLQRNQTWHNRPIQTPLLGSVNQMGNAADGEVWFADASYMLWKITGQDRFKKALDSSLFTSYEYTLIDSQDMFFRQTENDPEATPFTDGISYDWVYPGETEYEASRDDRGYIHAVVEGAAQYAVEQQSVKFRLGEDSKIRTTFGGVGITGMPVSARLVLTTSDVKNGGSNENWVATFPLSTSDDVIRYDVPITSMLKELDPLGAPYLTADTRDVTDYGGSSYAAVFEDDILEHWSGTTVAANFPDSDGGLVIGFWRFDNGTRPVNAITYKADTDFYARFSDDDGWRWYWPLPNTNNEWVNIPLIKGEAILSGYQPDVDPEATPPSEPNYTELGQITVLLDDDLDVDKNFSYYCINDLPERWDAEDGYTIYYTLTLSCQEAYDAYIGDCTVVDFRDDSLNYCPGVIPFSNIYQEGSEQFANWRGLPYPGYQYPVVYCMDGDVDTKRLNNIINFLWDAQQAYYGFIGELGPVASAYIWDRPDATAYGPANTWTMYHWGDRTAWSGYQPRAFQGACRAWHELVVNNKEVPPKLIEYVENWIVWLREFVKDNEGQTPTYFPPTSPAVVEENDFTGHMSGLFLNGCCMAAMAGSKVDGLPRLIETIHGEIQRNYPVNQGPNSVMNGGWSPWVGGGMFYGFWSGELLRGLGSYVLYHKLGVGESMYNLYDEPLFPEPENITPPTISGVPQKGETLSVVPGVWEEATDYTYSWYIFDTDNLEESFVGVGNELLLSDLHVGKLIFIRETAHGEGGSSVHRSLSVGPVSASAPTLVDLVAEIGAGNSKAAWWRLSDPATLEDSSGDPITTLLQEVVFAPDAFGNGNDLTLTNIPWTTDGEGRECMDMSLAAHYGIYNNMLHANISTAFVQIIFREEGVATGRNILINSSVEDGSGARFRIGCFDGQSTGTFHVNNGDGQTGAYIYNRAMDTDFVIQGFLDFPNDRLDGYANGVLVEDWHVSSAASTPNTPSQVAEVATQTNDGTTKLFIYDILLLPFIPTAQQLELIEEYAASVLA